MQEIIKEYGPALIAAMAIIAIAGLITALFNGENSTIGSQFTDLIDNFFKMAQGAAQGAAGSALETVGDGL